MKVGKYEIKTLEFYFFGYAVKMTQKYYTKYDMGHYTYVVCTTNSEKHIIDCGQTSGAPHDGAIDQALAKEHYERALRAWEEFQEMYNDEEK